MIFQNEPFLFVDPPETLPGAGFILSTTHPYYIGRVVKMKPEEVQMFTINTKRPYAFCDNYSIAILLEGSLINEKSFSVAALNAMADFYSRYRIAENPGRHKRYLL